MTSIQHQDPLSVLEGFLLRDPDNEGLRAEAFDLALKSGQRGRAAMHLQAGMAGGTQAHQWQLRAAHLHMAEHNWTDAVLMLNRLLRDERCSPELAIAVRHDLAWVSLRCRQIEEGLSILSPLANDGVPSVAVQALWLRLLHHADRLEEVLTCAKRWGSQSVLDAEVAGVAALAALDMGEQNLCAQWSALALARNPDQIEALVAHASLLLLGRRPHEAMVPLERVLQSHPTDGRALSALAFARMLAGELALARGLFENAVRYMPDHVGTWHGLAWVHLLSGDVPSAKSAFEASMALDRNFAESHGGLAVVHARMGERKAAEVGVTTALRLDKDCMSAQYAMALLDGKAGDVQFVQGLADRLMRTRGR